MPLLLYRLAHIAVCLPKNGGSIVINKPVQTSLRDSQTSDECSTQAEAYRPIIVARIFYLTSDTVN